MSGEPRLQAEADPFTWSTERFSFERGGALGAPRSGVSICFVDPDQTAVDANIFWKIENYQRVVCAYIRNHQDCGFGSIVSLRKFRCRKTLLKTVNGEQHLLLRDQQRVAQILCIGEDIRVDPFALELVIDQFPNTERRHKLIQRLADFYHNRRLSGLKSGWTVKAMRHRDALAALDQRMQERSYREIAVFLYGINAVQTDWTTPNQTMKNRVIRSVKRGYRMMDGGYKKLLK